MGICSSKDQVNLVNSALPMKIGHMRTIGKHASMALTLPVF